MSSPAGCYSKLICFKDQQFLSQVHFHPNHPSFHLFGCHSLHHLFSAPDLGLMLNVCQPPLPTSPLCFSDLPSGCCTLTLHYCHSPSRKAWSLIHHSGGLLPRKPNFGGCYISTGCPNKSMVHSEMLAHIGGRKIEEGKGSKHMMMKEELILGCQYMMQYIDEVL